MFTPLTFKELSAGLALNTPCYEMEYGEWSELHGPALGRAEEFFHQLPYWDENGERVARIKCGEGLAFIRRSRWEVEEVVADLYRWEHMDGRRLQKWSWITNNENEEFVLVDGGARAGRSATSDWLPREDPFLTGYKPAYGFGAERIWNDLIRAHGAERAAAKKVAAEKAVEEAKNPWAALAALKVR